MSDSQSIIKKVIWIVIALIIIAGAGFYFARPMLIKKTLPEPVAIDTQNQPVLGNPQAKIHFVAFEDLKCVNCARFNRELMPFIIKKYIHTHVANYTMINVAFINNSLPAANAARCVYTQNPKLFYPFVEYVFAHQPPEEQDWATIPTLMNFAAQIPGLNMTQLSQCIAQSPYTPIIQANLAQAMKLMKGAVSTPTLYINGVMVNPLTKSQIENVVEAVK